MIVLVNGSFGIGKTSVARSLAARLPGSIVFDPELIGIALQRFLRFMGRDVGDFQDLRLWRRLTIIALRAARMLRPNVIVPMAFSNAAYLDEIRAGLNRFEPSVVHYCLVAPLEVVHERLRRRGVDLATDAWLRRRTSECCQAHGRSEFATHIDATNGDVDTIAKTLLHAVALRP